MRPPGKLTSQYRDHFDRVKKKYPAWSNILKLPGLVLLKRTESQCLMKHSCKGLKVWGGLEGRQHGLKSQIIHKGGFDSRTDSQSLEPK